MQITVESGPLAGTKIPLQRDRQVLIGSAPDCDLHLDENGVAEQHAVVKALKGEGFGIKAMADGLLINGREAAAAPLRDGDEIRIGRTTLRYATAGTAEDTPIPGFRILGILGKGGMGVVYRAEQVSLRREVALKVLSRQLTKDPAFVSKFVAEARAAARLSHPNVVQVFDVDHDGDTYFYSMEVMHEGSLEGWLKRHGRMPVERALQVVADAASGLAYAESLGMVHRDIKPDNLMLDQHGTVKIADLGLAHAEEDPEEKLAGTPHFMAPEQVLRKGADHRTDLYALGCTFYRLITGRTPFRGGTVKEILRAHVKDAPEPPHKVDDEVPAEVSAIVLRLMAKDAAERYQSANELLADVRALLAPKARKGLWIGLTVAAVLVAGSVLTWALTRPEPEGTVEVRYRDNPEAQRLATENEALQAAAREDKAEIALLKAQLRGGAPEAFAAALEEIGRLHPGTRAASQADIQARSLRVEAERAAVAEAQRAEAVAQAVAALRDAVEPAIQQGEFGRALQALRQEPKAELRDSKALREARTALDERLRAAAADAVRRLRSAAEAARAGGDPAALEAALQALQAALAADTGLPAELVPDRNAQEQWIAEARAAIAAMRKERSEEQWTVFTARIAAADGLLAPIQRLDFAALGEQAAALRAQLGNTPAALRTGQLVQVAQQAQAFTAALQQVAQAGTLQLAMPDGLPQTVVRWQRDGEGAFVVLDQGRRPPKEIPVAQASLTPEQWAALARQVPNAPPGAAECFLGLCLLGRHATQARDWLRTVDRGNDASGSGLAGYPLGADAFESLLRRLPADDSSEWAPFLRHEVQAGRLLATGLRAFSERRNLAAAAHLDRLLQDFPHSLVVAALP